MQRPVRFLAERANPEPGNRIKRVRPGSGRARRTAMSLAAGGLVLAIFLGCGWFVACGFAASLRAVLRPGAPGSAPPNLVLLALASSVVAAGLALILAGARAFFGVRRPRRFR